MSPHGTVLPSTDETRSYLIGWWCFLSSCRKLSFSALRTAERSSTGMFTSPKARAPFQMDAIVPPLQGTTRAIHHLCTFLHNGLPTPSVSYIVWDHALQSAWAH